MGAHGRSCGNTCPTRLGGVFRGVDPPTHPPRPLPNQGPTRLLGILQPLEREVTPHPEGVWETRLRSCTPTGVQSGRPGCGGIWGAAERGSGVGGLVPTLSLLTTRVSHSPAHTGTPGLSGFQSTSTLSSHPSLHRGASQSQGPIQSSRFHFCWRSLGEQVRDRGLHAHPPPSRYRGVGCECPRPGVGSPREVSSGVGHCGLRLALEATQFKPMLSELRGHGHEGPPGFSELFHNGHGQELLLQHTDGETEVCLRPSAAIPSPASLLPHLLPMVHSISGVSSQAWYPSVLNLREPQRVYGAPNEWAC